MGFAPLDFVGNLLGIDSSAGEKQNLTEQFKQMRAAIEAYRPQAAQARMAGLGNILSPGMVSPINDQLAHMYGDGARFDTNALLRDPMGGMPGHGPNGGAVSPDLRPIGGNGPAPPPRNASVGEALGIAADGAASIPESIPGLGDILTTRKMSGYSVLGGKPKKVG